MSTIRLPSQATKENPIFAQRCPACNWIRVRQGAVWVSNNPEVGWYGWWEPGTLERYCKSPIPVLLHHCDDCLLDLPESDRRTLNDAFRTLEIAYASASISLQAY